MDVFWKLTWLFLVDLCVVSGSSLGWPDHSYPQHRRVDLSKTTPSYSYTTQYPPAPTYVPNTVPPPIIRLTPTHPPRSCRIQTCLNMVLKFSSMGLKRIGDQFVTSPTVQELYLDDNDIEDVSASAFGALTRLEVLTLSKNNLPTGKLLEFSNLDTLKTLILDDNKYTGNDHSIEHVDKPFPKLQKLSLRRDGIASLSASLNAFAPRLAQLYLSGNKIESVNFLKDPPASLSHLLLDDNRISSMDVPGLKILEVLNVSGNSLEELCGEETCNENALSLKGMSRLSTLDASRNTIREVQADSLNDMISLTFLNISHNQIRRLPDDLFDKMESLEKLLLGYNRLTSIPKVDSLIRAKLLDLTGNEIVAVTKDSFRSKLALETLLLANNHITNVDGQSFADLSSLKRIDLSNNLIVDLPVTMISVARSLQVVLLTNNSIISIDDLSRASTYLKELHLQNNPLPLISFGRLNTMRLPNLVVHLKSRPASLESENDGSDEDDTDEDVEE